jgi:hypothetical protein
MTLNCCIYQSADRKAIALTRAERKASLRVKRKQQRTIIQTRKQTARAQIIKRRHDFGDERNRPKNLDKNVRAGIHTFAKFADVTPEDEDGMVAVAFRYVWGSPFLVFELTETPVTFYPQTIRELKGMGNFSKHTHLPPSTHL